MFLFFHQGAASLFSAARPDNDMNWGAPPDLHIGGDYTTRTLPVHMRLRLGSPTMS